MNGETSASRSGDSDGAAAADRAEAPRDDVNSALDAVRESALRLLAGFPQPPTALRISAGGVTVEVDWQTAAPQAPAAPPVAAAAPAAVSALAAAPVAAAAPAPAAAAPAPAEDGRRRLRAPAVGVFFRAPEPGAKPFVEVGDSVVAGQQVAIIEVMKLMIPVTADADGTIAEVLKENGDPVEYDEPLFALNTL
ncbi:acetyl-CoA carboxylase biotin carboxyl carrier protein [Allonocardiopsis opalescens]|uniref:Biotin carboxyl carrier protein of acetyl-CoA carboxylase n=1 Tax=Allonocardiopsis opalescens TaxID=1144618 RepID=A0A2T0QB22_9ACTN|nr:biotin/lipoyl-containing protein [Allonocardiopsis opalescens]PRY01011.1 acetyl-CoA carboxylase biotin carboxyl carrier protein [Allonocardiopsis opalescens]